MNRKLLKSVVRFLSAVGASALLWVAQPISCGPLAGPSPAAPPAPPAEIPAALTFPQSVDIGFGTPSEEATLDLVRPLVPIGGEFFEAIQFGFDVNFKANSSVQGILDSLSTLEIPLSPPTSTFEVTSTGGFFGKGIKIDFADYAFPGKPEACTGCSCPLGCNGECDGATEVPEENLKPVCYRIWRDDAFDDSDAFLPFMAGFMTRLPTKDNPDTAADETNAGNGEFRLHLEDAFTIDNNGAIYKHRNSARPLDKTTDLHAVNISKPSSFTTGQAVVNLVNTAQIGLDGATNADQVRKTLRYTAGQESPIGVADPDHDLRYLAQFREDADFWSGTLLNNLETNSESLLVRPPDRENFENQCAELSTAVGVEQLTCEDLGIDVTDVPFVDLLPSNDPSLNLPADFPVVPTF